MAKNKIRGITIEIGGDTSGLSKALSDVNKDLKSTQNGLKDVNKLLKFDGGNVDLLRQKQGYLNDAIKETEEKLKTERQYLDELKNTEGFDKNSEQAKALERQIAADEQALKNLKAEAKDFGNVTAQQFKAAGQKIGEFGDKIKGVGDSIGSVGTTMTTKVTAPIVGIGTAAVKVTADFDSAMSRVQALSGSTADEFEKLRNTAREMGATTKFSATESAEAMQYMALAGWDAEEIVAGIPGVLNLAAASGEELGNVSDILTDSMTAFGLSAEHSNEVADAFAKTMASSNTTVGLMGETFKYVAPVAGAMGYSLEDVALATGLMANNGIKGSMAGTTLRNVMQRMAKPTDEVQTAMDRLGLSLADSEGNMYSFREIMDQMRSSFGEINMPIEEFNQQVANLDTQLEAGEITESAYQKALEELTSQAYGAEGAEKARAAAMLGGARAMSGILAIVNTSEEEYNQLADAINNSAGSAEDMATTMNDNLGGQLEILKSQVFDLAISFGDTLMPTIREVVGFLQGLVTSFNSLDESQRQQIVKIAAIVAAVGPVLLILGKVISTVGLLVHGIGAVVSVIGTVVGVLGGPLTLAIGAVIAIGVLLYKNWDKIKEAAGKLKEWVVDKWNKLKEGVSNAASKVKETVSNKWNEMKTNTSTVMNAIKTTASTQLNAMKTAFNDAGGGIKGAIAASMAAVKSNFQTAFNTMDRLTGGKLSEIKNKVTEKFNAIKDTIKEKLESAKETVRSMIDKIKGFFNFQWELPHLKLPHFSVSGSMNPMDWFTQGVPHISVEWYKKAYDNPVVFSKPTVLQTPSGYKGFGDGSGAEVVMGMNKLKDIAGDTNIQINVYGAEGQNVTQLANEIERRLVRAQKQKTAVWA